MVPRNRKEVVEQRMKGYDSTANISWDKVKKRHGI